MSKVYYRSLKASTVYLIMMPAFGQNLGQKVVHIFKEFAEVLSFMKDEHAQLSDFCENNCACGVCYCEIDCDDCASFECEHHDFCHSFIKEETDISPRFIYKVYHYTIENDMGFYFKERENTRAPTKLDARVFWKNATETWKGLKNIEHKQCKNWMQINVSSESEQDTFIYDMKLK